MTNKMNKIHKSIIAFTCCIVLSSCESEQDRLNKVLEKQINTTIQMDWSNGIPLNQIDDAYNICRNRPYLKDCKIVQEKMDDIATSVASCVPAHKSRICQAVIRDLDIPDVSALLPEVSPLPLPESPFFWSMPTETLEKLSPLFQFRTEAFDWWWGRWKIFILSCLALFVVIYAILVFLKKREARKRRQAFILFRQREEQIEKERQRLIQEENAREIAERQEDLEFFLYIDELQKEELQRERQAEELLAKQKEAEKSAKLEKEKNEAAQIYKSVLQSPKKKRKTSDPTQ